MADYKTKPYISRSLSIQERRNTPKFNIIDIFVLLRSIEELNNYLLHGFSWNLDVGNNFMCRKYFSK